MQRALCLVMILAVPLGARGAGGPAERRALLGNWRMLVYRLPGGYRFLDRLELKEQQTKVLGEIHREWMAG